MAEVSQETPFLKQLVSSGKSFFFYFTIIPKFSAGAIFEYIYIYFSIQKFAITMIRKKKKVVC
jgi:hypothetical protein